MRAAEIRQAFLDFFEGNGHTVVESSPLVPDDPSLLFVNAGMVQFKNAFLGLDQRSYSRAATAQKCLRVSGKHNDIEEVGPSPRHHTFFEMLGNFSFGDYFKSGAIEYAWDFLLNWLELDAAQLWPTVYEDDDEAARLWSEITGVPDDRIGRLPASENWWSMGETGPNGPCSEIFYDRGVERCTCSHNGKCTPYTASVEEDCDRFWEIWNLVFMQYHTDESGQTSDLSAPCVDTGMGFERIAAVLQNGATNYDTDIFEPLMETVRQLTGHSDADMNNRPIPYRVLADHGRAMTFLLADGVVPGNEERSYILRMLIRRAIRFGKQLGLQSPFLGQVVETVIDEMGHFYGELPQRRDFIVKAVHQEEQRFARTFETGMSYIDDLIRQKQAQNETVIAGEEAFFLHDTHGFHIQIVEDIAQEHGLSVDRQGFEREMEKQRERSAAGTKGTGHPRLLLEVPQRKCESDPTSLACSSKVVHLANSDGHSIEAAEGGEEALLVVERSPFYPEGGGQIADTGSVVWDRGEAQVLDVQKTQVGIPYHRIRVTQGSLAVGDECALSIDVDRRLDTQRNHTATHILHAALRKALGYEGGIQAGSRVAPDELRFDFTHLEGLSDDEIREVEDMANEVILGDRPVEVAYEPLTDAKARGAMALFPEDYQGRDKVRTVAIPDANGTDDPFSIELCGGTHVDRTGEIGMFKITREEGVSAGVRRVYVATGKNLFNYLLEKEQRLQDVSAKLDATEGEVVGKLEALLEQRKSLEAEVDRLQHVELQQTRDALLERSERVGDAAMIAAQADLDGDALKELADLLEDQLRPGVVLLGSGRNGKAVVVSKVSDALTDRVRAGDLVREAAEEVGGKGGGNPKFAQGGGPNPDNLRQALEATRASVREIFQT